MEWLAGEKTKVVGTFPPRKRGWTGYIEKDTAGQTNIYSVEVDTHSFEIINSKTLVYTNAPKQHFILELCYYQLLKHKNISILLKNCLIRK